MPYSPIIPNTYLFLCKRKAEDSNKEFTDKKVKQIVVPTTPESIAEFLEGQEGVKDDFTKPHQLCENEFNFQRKGRDETLHGIYDYIVERYFRIKKASDKGKSVGGKTYHHALTIQATPGGGKSFLLDELAALKNEDFDNYLRSKNHQHPFIIEDEEDCCYNEAVNNVINMLHNSVAVCITYNGHSAYNFDEFVDDNIERGLVMRILWSYFFDDGKLSWQNFCEKFKTNFESLNIRTVVQSILYHSKKRVLLCIDEIMKILSGTDTNQKQAKVNKFLNHLYNPYQEFAKDKEELIKFNFILTTLDAVYVQSNMTDSGRQIEWIPLRRLEISESAELFNEVIRSLNLEENRLFVIKKCISDCNGHPRTLEKFYQVFNSNKEAQIIHNYSSLIAILTNHIRDWYKNISFPVVKMALLGESVRLSHVINTNGEQLSISALVSSGDYINSLTEKSEAQFVIPTLSPVSLQYFCLNNEDDGDAKIATKIIQRLLTTESSFDDEVMDGRPFERFHANWELLYRVLRENGKKISLHEIYGLSDRDKEEIEIQLQRKRIAYCHEEIEFPPNDTIYNSS
ncbi:8105_t:CDS:2 [Entrophospora sp. SA101]|nr:564_t:CDS:2 [Entrophospora sp. SA101]CAJ0871733.1 8105_t:CDS:2 [Entrophospora sp. SA101]